ncbi:hypothetical protein J2794_006580 [Paraburkholderia terricola]|uniref:hypothetical protein n=1 Tax=Paraburkholderia terricola TaxID=169427 RepID=UPI00285859F3|nr:hypothetical protein [Paraburkholderia terricola]MDR6450439.1 hypothetical protein [Paraburkholderia terricola]
MTQMTPKLGFAICNALSDPEHRCYRPPDWPPPPDWIVSEDVDGTPVSLWSDALWDFSTLAGRPFKLDFAGGKTKKHASAIGAENQNILRLLATWLIWGRRGVKSWHYLKQCFGFVRRVVALCDRAGILASDLSRFPAVLGELSNAIPHANDRKLLLIILDRLLRAECYLGFSLVDHDGLTFLSKVFASDGTHATEQTAYIPPRIWTYHVVRLRECLDDFLQHKSQIEGCYDFCLNAYARNFGSLSAAFARSATLKHRLPFRPPPKGNGPVGTGCQYFGPFLHTTRKFGIDGLFRKWVWASGEATASIKSFSAYLTLVQYAGIAYLMTFTLQRKEEAASLRSDCLLWDRDPVLGALPIIRGETTKTDPDTDARWPTSPSVEVAIKALTSIARMRIRCAEANPLHKCSEYDKANPYLYQAVYEPWSGSPSRSKPYATRSPLPAYALVVQRFPLLFDLDVLKITEDDLAYARMFSPNLSKRGKFERALPWPLSFHQLRRTGAINMFASGLLSDSSIQVILKHITLQQTRYYGKNYSRAGLNADYQDLTSTARFEVIAKHIEALVGDRYVSPIGKDRKMEIVTSLVSSKDFSMLVEASRKGEVSFRETRLGGCVKKGHCEYGGVESISRCSGGDGEKPCRDALFDKAKRFSAEHQLESVQHRLEHTQPDSPRATALRFEANGLRSFLDVVLD